jgi:hypothetical protein
MSREKGIWQKNDWQKNEDRGRELGKKMVGKKMEKGREMVERIRFPRPSDGRGDRIRDPWELRYLL